MQTMNDESRAQVARGWEVSGLSQAAYAAQHGIKARTLRAWRRQQHAGRQRDVRTAPPDTVRAALVDAIGKLQDVLASLDAKAAIGSHQTCSDGAGAAPLTSAAAPCRVAEVARPETEAFQVAAARARPLQHADSGWSLDKGTEPGKKNCRSFFDWDADGDVAEVSREQPHDVAS